MDFTGFLPRLDNPMGLDFLGVLEQVKELALEIDAIFNQMTDANSLSVTRPFFYDPSGDLDAPALEVPLRDPHVLRRDLERSEVPVLVERAIERAGGRAFFASPAEPRSRWLKWRIPRSAA